ncbi:MAG: YfhO family protein, partial [Armatimonadota bacterium]
MRWLEAVNRKDLAALGVIVAVALVILWPVTFGDRVLLPADLLLRMEPWRAHAEEYGFERVQNPILDPIQQHYPWRKFAAEQAREDQVPLWNPYMSCGAPFLANNQSAPFYPETWLFYLLPVGAAFGWAAFVYMLLSGGFMYWFLRTIGCRPEAALVGALPFMLSGFAIGWMAYPTLRSVPAWLPLMLLAHEKTVRGARGSWWLLGALAVGMQFLAGHLHISFFVLLVFVGYVIFRAASGADGKRNWRTLLPGGAALAVGTLIGAVQILPVAELVSLAGRSTHSFTHHLGFALAPASFLTGLMPDIFGNPVDYNYWGEHVITVGRAYLENNWYVGVAPIFLAPAALLFSRGRQRWFWLGALVVGVGIAWGTGIYRVFYELIPPLRGLPGINRAIIIVDVALAVMVGLGMEAIVRQIEQSGSLAVEKFARNAGTIILAIGVIGGLVVWFYTGALEQALPGIGGYSLIQIAIFAVLAVLVAGAIGSLGRYRTLAVALLIAVIALDLGRCAVRFIPMVPREYLHIETEALAAMEGAPGTFRMMSLPGEGNWITRMPPNLPMACGLECVESSDSLLVPWYEQMLKCARDEEGYPKPELPLWNALNTEYLLTPREIGGRWEKITAYETNVYENTKVLPRFYSPASVKSVESAEEAKAAVTSADFRPKAELIMVGQPESDQWEYLAGSVREWSPNRLMVDLPQPDRWYVLASTVYPGWRAFSAGGEIPITPANYTLRGLRPEQAGDVEF